MTKQSAVRKFSFAYLWISGLFLGFLISTSAAFLWYMAKRSLKVMSEERKCWAASQEQKQKLVFTNSWTDKLKRAKVINCPSGLWWSRYWLSQEISWNQHRSYSTFYVVYNWDYMLIEQLRGAAAELCRLNMLENGAKFHIFLTEWFTGNGRAVETEQPQFKKCNMALKQNIYLSLKIDIHHITVNMELSVHLPGYII